MLQDPVNCQTDPDLFFSDLDYDKEKAKELCSSCWFKDQCFTLGLTEIHGIWGGFDFSRTQPKKSSETCRNGLHPKPEKGTTCKPCRHATHKKYYEKNKKVLNSRTTEKRKKDSKPRKNVLGGYCVNGHLLEESNVSIRSKDRAVLCKKCYAGQKTRDQKALSSRTSFW